MMEFWVDPDSPYFKDIFGQDGKKFVFIVPQDGVQPDDSNASGYGVRGGASPGRILHMGKTRRPG